MTDEQAFLAAVLAAPGDDLPRLVYADWLDEHGGMSRNAGILSGFVRLTDGGRGAGNTAGPLTTPTFRGAGMADTMSIDAVLAGQPLVGPRFERRVGRGDGCWDWTGRLHVHGYGKYWQAGRYHGAHRIAYQFVFGPLPAGIYVCHKCDNRKCVRPDHLFAGTAADNNRDMWEKGRGVVNGTPQPGGENPQAVLSERDIQLIKRLVLSGVQQTTVAEAFQVSASAVSDIIRGRRWAHAV